MRRDNSLSHEIVIPNGSKSQYCILCTVNHYYRCENGKVRNGNRKGYRVKTRCLVCGVAVCKVPRNGESKSCFERFHDRRALIFPSNINDGTRQRSITHDNVPSPDAPNSSGDIFSSSIALNDIVPSVPSSSAIMPAATSGTEGCGDGDGSADHDTVRRSIRVRRPNVCFYSRESNPDRGIQLMGLKS